MNPSALFVRRPVMTWLLTISLAIFGIAAYRLLPVSDLPNADFPTIQVSAMLAGANAETMASSVATPLEKQFSSIPGVDAMSSASSQDSTTITLQFALDRNVDAAALDVQSAISAAQRQLPPEMTAPPSMRKVNPADQAVFYIALSSETMSMSKVSEYAETTFGQRLSMLPGVAQANVYGSQKYAVRIQIDPGALASRGVGIDEVQSAIENQSVHLPVGTLMDSHRLYTVEVNGQLRDAAEFGALVVAYKNGAPIRLAELGRVLDSTQYDRTYTSYNGARAVIIAIQRQPGYNTVATVNGVKQLMQKLQKDLPADLHIATLYDRSVSIVASLNDVKVTLVLAVVLVIIVIFLFLRTTAAAVIPGVALPLSLIGTFAVMYAFDFSLDNLSLMALTLCVGFVVDDAIVMLENVARHIEEGKSPYEATLIGSREIGFTILSMTLSLLAVFIPILFMRGILGRLLHEFAIVIMAAVLLSGLISLSLTPLMCSRLRTGALGAGHGGFFKKFEDLFERSRRAYAETLDVSLRHRHRVLWAFLALTLATAVLFMFVPKGFLPGDDSGRIYCVTEAAQDISFDAMRAKQEQIARLVRANPYVEGVMSIVGVLGSNNVMNQGRIIARLKPARDRPDANTIVRQLRPKMNGVIGMRVFLQAPPVIQIGTRISKSLYQYTLQDANTAELFHWAPIVEARIRQLDGFEDVTSDLEIGLPQLGIEIDRGRAGALGVTASQIENALYSAYGPRQVATIYTPTNQYWVLLEVLPEYRRDASAFASLYVRSNTGALVPLGAVTKQLRGVAPLTINHAGQVPAVTISFNLAEGVALGTGIQRIEAALGKSHVPEGLTGVFQGTAQAFQSSLAGLGGLIVLAIFVIYIVLGILYESYIHPITILSGLPTAAFGALATLMLFGRELDLYGFVGVIMLIGIVKKNAIMMIDYALERERQDQAQPLEAIREACAVRFRPIMMTTMAALFGTLPIALGVGASGASRQTLGLAVVGGLLVSQLLTLYITPVVYLGLHRFERRSAEPRKALAAGAAAPQ